MILLATDECALYPPAGDADAHGWALGPDATEPIWTGLGSVQLGLGISGLDAAESDGHGPFDPSHVEQGQVFLPADAPAADGMLLVARGNAYQLAFTRLIPDPVGGPLGALVANLSEVEAWLPARSL